MVTVKSRHWGTLKDGRPARLFELSNGVVTVRISDFGGIITSVLAPDRNGVPDDIILGYDTVARYEDDDAYMGAMVGRYANRIKGGSFTLGGTTYRLTKNEGENQLHGGTGFHKQLWAAEALADGVVLRLHSPDGADGFPGNADVTAVVRLSGPETNRLSALFTAVSDKDTVFNLTNHAYFNLRCLGDILGHKVRLNADRYTPVDNSLIPTGEIRAVAGTEFDFTNTRIIENGFYDHNFVLSGGDNPAAYVVEPETGRTLSVYTTMPGIQFYCGGSLTPRKGKHGDIGRYGGFCLEPQFFPNSPNVPHFPSCAVLAGELYRQEIVYIFGTEL